jgi:carboxylesterase
MADRFPVIGGAEPWSSPGHGKRAGVGIVVVHGFTGCPVSVRPLGERLAERGFAVEVPRLPGHGTHVLDLVKTRYVDWRGEVERVFHDLKSRTGATLLVGLSMGGTLVLDMAAQLRGVAGVVSINALISSRDDIGSRLAPILSKIIPVAPASFAGLAKNDCANGADEKAYPWVSPRAGYSLLRELPRIRSQLAWLRAPLLVAYSPQDHSVDPENSRTILQSAGSQDVTELRLERSYHVATLDYDLDLLEHEISAFADRITGNKTAAPLESLDRGTA